MAVVICQSGKSVLIRFERLISCRSGRENFCFAYPLLLCLFQVFVDFRLFYPSFLIRQTSHMCFYSVSYLFVSSSRLALEGSTFFGIHGWRNEAVVEFRALDVKDSCYEFSLKYRSLKIPPKLTFPLDIHLSCTLLRKWDTFCVIYIVFNIVGRP